MARDKENGVQGRFDGRSGSDAVRSRNSLGYETPAVVFSNECNHHRRTEDDSYEKILADALGLKYYKTVSGYTEVYT